MVSWGNITLVCQYLFSRQPFYKGSSLHPEELKPNFGCLLLIMSLSFVVLLDHITNYLFFLSDTPSFWFALNMSYNHAFHLSRWFGMSPHNNECLFVAISVAIAVSAAAAAIFSAAIFSWLLSVPPAIAVAVVVFATATATVVAVIATAVAVTIATTLVLLSIRRQSRCATFMSFCHAGWLLPVALPVLLASLPHVPLLADGYVSPTWRSRRCNDHLYVCKENGWPDTIMGLLHALIQTLINISYRGIQLLSTFTFLTLAKICRLYNIGRYSKIF